MNTFTLTRTVLLVMGLSGSVLAVAAEDAMKQFNDLDVNHDGYIDRSEATSDAMLRERWNNVDMDKNDKLNFKEFERFQKTPDEPFPIPK